MMLKIGFDAKRAFMNRSGLGNYSRTLLRALREDFPQHHYVLFTPKVTDLFPERDRFQLITPHTCWDQTVPAYWRRFSTTREAKALDLDIYHGLSHELPVGLEKTGMRSVVTIHDLIFEKFPEQYPWLDRMSYRHKVQHACDKAHCIVTISAQTKHDLTGLYKIPEEKIRVVHLCADPCFSQALTPLELDRVRQKYHLPPNYIFHVGAFNRRKNHLKLLEAFILLPGDLDLQMVLVGDRGSEEPAAERFIRRHDLEKRVKILRQVPQGDMTAIFQCANLLVYNSLLEGFGLPILEGFHSRIPVITSTGSVFSEVGGDACVYVDPQNAQALAETIYQVSTEPELRSRLIHQGMHRASWFTSQNMAGNYMEVYEQLIGQMDM